MTSITKIRPTCCTGVVLTFIAVVLMITPAAEAQNEIARQIHSLQGIQQLGFTVNVETTISLSERGEIEVTSLQSMGENTLREGGIDVIPDEQVRQSDQIPFLYMHINTMDAGEGLVPFHVTLFFYQPVKLPLNRDIQTTAATWESSTLGIVSYDRLNLIEKAARNTLNEFVSDFNRANNRTN